MAGLIAPQVTNGLEDLLVPGRLLIPDVEAVVVPVQALLSAVSRMIAARGETSFPHVFSDNAPAIALYHRMGLRIRRRLYVTVLRNVS